METKLNHIKLAEKYPKAYDTLKDIYDNHNDGQELWMNNEGVIEIIENETVMGEFEERDMFYFLDFFNIYSYMMPVQNGNVVELSGYLYLPDGKHKEICTGDEDRKEVEKKLMIGGMEVLNEYLEQGKISYNLPTNEEVRNNVE